MGLIEAEVKAEEILELTEVGFTDSEILELKADASDETDLAATDTAELIDVESIEAVFKMDETLD